METKEQKTPRLSVLIPVHGDAPYLDKTLESILKQDVKDFEILVVLDRPSIQVAKYIYDLQAKTNLLRVEVSTSPGLVAALNFGIQKSACELIARIDSDDVMHVSRLRIQKEFMDNNPQVVCVGSQIRMIDATDSQIGHSYYPTSDHQIRSTLLFRNCIAHPSVMYRKSKVVQVGGYRATFDGAEDYDLWLRMSKYGRFANLTMELTSYRIWNNQVTQTRKGELEYIANEARKSFYFEGSKKPSQYISDMRYRDRQIRSAYYFNLAIEEFRHGSRYRRGLANLFHSFQNAPILYLRVTNCYIGALLSIKTRRVTELLRWN
jgi:glycosyltransferase involved in cell wall biosynthesis